MDRTNSERFSSKYALWKDRLLDLTAANRSLNFRPAKVASVQITLPSASGVLAALLDERSLSFPLYRGRREENGQQREIVTPGEIETTRTASDLEKSLHRLTGLAKVFREERGVNTLYLAVGMLNWQPAEGASLQKAPLMLVPVDLKREDRLKPYYLHAFDEDPELNPTLIYMLKRDFQFVLPELKEDWDAAAFDSFLNRVEKSVKSRGWGVERTTWLAQFNFKKLAMYRDLEQHTDDAKNNAQLGAIAGIRGPGPRVEIPSEASFDDLSPRDVFTAFDADSSQLNVLLRAAKGQDLVIEGPPGTGKSQTIANLISQFLLDGKKVLFVSEKVAALDVVHARLREAGLATFCLELHSDKASKRDVLTRINRAAFSDVPKPPDVARDITNLQQSRQQLNEYVRALHRPDSFGRTAFLLHGELASLADVPNVDGDFAFDARSMTIDDEERLIRLLNRLRDLPALYRSDRDHPWRGCTVEAWSSEVASRIEGELKAVSKSLDPLQELAKRIADTLLVSPPESIGAAEKLHSLAQVAVESPLPPRHWLDNERFGKLYVAIERESVRQSRARELRLRLDRSYRPGAYDLDTPSLLSRLAPSSMRYFAQGSIEVECGSCTKRTRVPPVGPAQKAQCEHCGETLEVRSESARTRLANVARVLIPRLREYAEIIAQLREEGRRLSAALGEQTPSNLGDFTSLTQAGGLLRAIDSPSEACFDANLTSELVTTAEEGLSKRSRSNFLKTEIGRQFSNGIHDLAVDEIRNALTQQYRSPIRFLRPGYHRLMRSVRQHQLDSKRLIYPQALAALDMAVETRRIQEWFDAHTARLTELYGHHYCADATVWESILELARAVQETHRVKPGLLNRPAVQDSIVAGYEFGPSTDCIRDLLERRLQQAAVIRDCLTVEWSSTENLDDAFRTSRAFQSDLEHFVETHETILAVRTAPAEPDVLDADMRLLQEFQEVQTAIREAAVAASAQYGALYQGGDTDWDGVRDVAKWCESLLELAPADDGVRDAVCDATRMASARATIEGFTQRLSAASEAVARIERRFALGTWVPAFKDRSFADVRLWSEARLQHLDELDEWIEYRSVLEDAERQGISQFIHAARSEGVAPDLLVDVFRKRIRVLQLDEAYRRNELLARFRATRHTEAISRFRELDQELQKAHRRRIVATVAADRPDLSSVAAGQVQFLRRELAKQRRHSPLRKLFERAGNTILSITPCLLMSPLSVATYLPKDSALFDVVIFDEASQMPPEEAIGPILRAKQVVVAGDPKQMPPSRFFEKSYVDDEEDDEDEAQAPLESILEDCQAAGFEARRLEWHYRSKHESLISFSNAEFYDNALVTFPSSTDKGERLGVRLVFTPNGIYDRGRSKTNRVEAREVAALVAAHYDGPVASRSLGIIALSTAQAEAIEEEIERLQVERPDLDARMKTTVAEPFFIKALENVQGDERDEVIISVGYAKASDGKFALNLGPVSLDGGERRLNVAFTRARYQVTLVSSVRAVDIDISRAKRSGPAVLKRYLEFAQTGRLPVETETGPGETESPFEEAVKAALEAAGVEVVPQVGVSRYRIDLGIKDRRAPGRYLLGVECDGAMYHSSHVARDRDRLRQKALEDRGWKIFRIWSTEWIRDPKGVLARLLQRINELQTEPLLLFESEPVQASTPPADEPPPTMDVDDVAETISRSERSFAVEYSEAALGTFKRELFESDGARIRDLVREVVEREGPVHEEVVITRIARAYQLQRTGVRIEEAIRRQIAASIRLANIKRFGEFLWPTRSVEVAPRRTADGEPQRQIEHIAPEEIASAVALVVKHSGGIEPAELPREVARVFGFLRTGHRVESAIMRVVNGMIRKEEIVRRGSFLTVAGD